VSTSPAQLAQGDGDWLAECRGFEVDSPRGRVGVLAEVRRGAVSGRPEALVVRRGLARDPLVIPVDEVAGVVTSKRVVVLQ
jgi:hypothetical protein